MFAPESFNVQKHFFGCKIALKPTDVNLGEVLPKTEGAKVKVFQTCFTNKFGGNEKIIEIPTDPDRSRHPRRWHGEERLVRWLGRRRPNPSVGDMRGSSLIKLKMVVVLLLHIL